MIDMIISGYKGILTYPNLFDVFTSITFECENLHVKKIY